MPKGLFVDATEHAVMKEYDDAPVGEGQVRIAVEFAAIKHGTLFTLFSGKSPFEQRQFDLERRLFVPREPGKAGGLVGHFIGDTVVGTVTDVGAGVTRYKVGDRVFGYGPAKQTLIGSEKHWRPLVEPMTESDAVCVDPAQFALAGVRDARACVGDHVVVFGMGAIGLFAVQLLRKCGCLSVIAVDMMPNRRALALELGATAAVDPAAGDVGTQVRDILNNPLGADYAIEISGSYHAMQDAIRCVRPSGRVVVVAYHKGGAAPVEFGAECYHNRLDLIFSMPVWGNVMREHPLWDEPRLVQTVVELFRRRQLSSERIVGPIVDFEQAAEAFMQVYRNPGDAIKLCFRVPGGP